MEIPALWTDLNAKQVLQAHRYVSEVVHFTITNPVMLGYRTTMCRDPAVLCGWCQCPIGRNHTYFDSVTTGDSPPVCFDCAEEMFYLTLKGVFIDDWGVQHDDETCLPTPEFLANHRLPKEVLNP